jgi:hypothetical protein
MKPFFLLFAALLLQTCSSKEKTVNTNFSVEYSTDYFHMKNGLFIRSYLSGKDSLYITVNDSVLKKIKKAYIEHDINLLSEDYVPIPVEGEIPLMSLNLQLNTDVSVRIDGGSYAFFERRKVKRIRSFCSEVFSIIYQDEKISNLPPSDVIYF